MLTHNADAYSYTDGTFPQAATSFAGKTYTYDDNGNLSSKDDGSVVSTYTYDWNDRLSNVKNDGTTIADYAYTDARQRLSKSVGTSTKYYINNYVEYDGDYANHVFAGAHRVLTSDTDGIHYTHKDHLQSTSLTTDSSGIVEEAVDYKTFGSERDRSGTHESAYTFTDQEFDSVTALHYMNARYYDADLKRFTSVDAWGGELGNPQTMNKYSYVMNNPIKYNDPSGNCYNESSCDGAGDAAVGAPEALWDATINAADQVTLSIWGLWNDNAQQASEQHAYNNGQQMVDTYNTLSNLSNLPAEERDYIIGQVEGSLGLALLTKKLVIGSNPATSWNRGTFDSPGASLQYHVGKHGAGRSSRQYTNDGNTFYQNYSDTGTPRTLRNGDPGTKITNSNNNYYGIYDSSGKQVTHGPINPNNSFSVD